MLNYYFCLSNVNIIILYCDIFLQKDSCSSGEGEDVISEEEIQKFRANQLVMNTKRQELRATLKQRFEDLHQRCLCHDCHVKLRAKITAEDDTALCSRTAKMKIK